MMKLHIGLITVINNFTIPVILPEHLFMLLRSRSGVRCSNIYESMNICALSIIYTYFLNKMYTFIYAITCIVKIKQ